MRRCYLQLLVVIACAVLWPSAIARVDSATADNQPVTIADDQTAGHVTVDSPNIKAVWHYKATAAENYNQGGGNLYELYYKPMDPGLNRNLVSYRAALGWGNGQSTAIWPGIGGIGATTLYASSSQVPYGQTRGFADILGDNNLGATLISHSAVIDQNGNAVLSFAYQVKNQSTSESWYQVTKTWTVEPGGAIHFKIDWTIIRSGYFAEPSMRTNWSYDVGWDQFEKYGRDWLQPGQPKYLLGASGISSQTSNCWDNLNRFVPDWISYTGSNVAPTLTMAPDNNGLGFSATGSYALGVNAWGSQTNPVQEQCSIQSSQNQSAHVINWMASWGGNPPPGSRYQRLNAGTAWSDSYRIDLTAGVPDGGPLISSVSIQQITGTSTTASWVTNTAADSVVEVSTNPDDSNSWTRVAHDSYLTTSHSLTINQLNNGAVYSYRIKSTDQNGRLSVSSSYVASSPSGPPFDLSLTATGTHWQSYSDYTKGFLAVRFNITNLGPSDAKSIYVVAAYASGGASVVSQLPIAVGDLAPGAIQQLDLTYHVPSSVFVFNTKLYGHAQSNDGTVFYYPARR